MATTLSEAQAAQSLALTQAFKQAENREAARIAALIALYYQQRVNVEDPASIERWLEIMIPRLIRSADTGAERARIYFETVRRIELGDTGTPGGQITSALPEYRPTASTGTVDTGVRKSLLTVGPYDYANKAREIRDLDLSPAEVRVLLTEAKRATTLKVAAASIRHAQAGSRQTIHDNAARDRTALGWVRVTRATPCAFCAMLTSRGLQYRTFKENSFTDSDSRFTGDGDAKVHDSCGCSLKPVFSENDPLVDQTKKFADLWTLWGAGGGDAALRFRRAYEHWVKTGEQMTWDEANEGLRPA